MKILNSEDLFIFSLLTPEETAQLIEILNRYASECADSHNPAFIDSIADERLRSAFTYFNNKFRRRRPRRQSSVAPAQPEVNDDMVKSPSTNAHAEIAAAALDSRISLRKSVADHCRRIAPRFRPCNKNYNLLRANPEATASVLLDLENSGFSGAVVPYLVARLRAADELASMRQSSQPSPLSATP